MVRASAGLLILLLSESASGATTMARENRKRQIKVTARLSAGAANRPRMRATQYVAKARTSESQPVSGFAGEDGRRPLRELERPFTP